MKMKVNQIAVSYKTSLHVTFGSSSLYAFYPHVTKFTPDGTMYSDNIEDVKENGFSLKEYPKGISASRHFLSEDEKQWLFEMEKIFREPFRIACEANGSNSWIEIEVDTN